MTYWRMRRVTEAYRKAAGQPYKEVPDELIVLEKELKELRKEIERRRAAGITDEELGELLARLADLEYRYRQLVIQFEELEPKLPG